MGVVEGSALWGLMLGCEALVRDAAATDDAPALAFAPPGPCATSLTQLAVNVAERFRRHIQAHTRHWVDTRAHGATMRLVLSFVLTTLKARLRKPAMFPRLEGLTTLWPVLLLLGKRWTHSIGQLVHKLSAPAPARSVPDSDVTRTLGYLKTAAARHALPGGTACIKLLLCGWGACTNMAGPSELQLPALPCTGGCNGRNGARCTAPARARPPRGETATRTTAARARARSTTAAPSTSPSASCTVSRYSHKQTYTHSQHLTAAAVPQAATDPHVYNSFMAILTTYRTDNTSPQDVHNKVRVTKRAGSPGFAPRRRVGKLRK
jgi:hypothetical protein